MITRFSAFILSFLLTFCFFIEPVHAELKNVQQVLGGFFTRAGVKNQKPLSNSELVALCEQGYANAFFTYAGAKTQLVSCSRGQISYMSQNNPDVILQATYKAIQNGKKVFVHCHNGAHMSGFHAALALRQFCGLSGDAAFAYWDQTLNGYPLQEPNRSVLHRRMVNFQPKNWELTAEQKSALCSDL